MEDIKACVCKDISLKQLFDAINKGHKTIEELQKELSIGTVCSMCLSEENDPQGERPIHLDKLLKGI